MLKIGVCGMSWFGDTFAHTFSLHPDVGEIVGADTSEAVRNHILEKKRVTRMYRTMDELCMSDVDAILVSSPPWLHVEHTLQALAAGKHVLCACPAALNMDDLNKVIEAVKKSGLVYMTAETSYYYPDTVYCKKLNEEGRFGDIVFTRASYNFAPLYSGYDFWTRDYYGNFPSVLYMTHSTARILGAIGKRFTKVSAMGTTRLHPTVQNAKRLPEYSENEFSNMSAFLRMDNESNCQINEFRNVAAGGEDFSVYGTDAVFSNNTGTDLTLSSKGNVEDLKYLVEPYWYKYVMPTTYEEKHPHYNLLKKMPKPKGENWGSSIHQGSHAFLVHEFVSCCLEDMLPLNNVWTSAKYCAPGIMAYESVKNGGAWMEIPDFEEPPANKKLFTWD
jgi:predicted dehydrogenase